MKKIFMILKGSIGEKVKMVFKAGILKAVILLLGLSIFSCSWDQAENIVRSLNRSLSDNSGAQSRLSGKWFFSVSGDNSKLVCYINPTGKAYSGSCSKGYMGENIATLSLFDFNSYIEFNLIDQKVNRLVGLGRLYYNGEGYSGNGSFIHKNGTNENRQCYLERR